MNTSARVSFGFMNVVRRGLFALVLLAGLGTFSTTPAQAESALAMGVPLALEFDAGGYVDQVLVTVKKGWLNSGNFALHITITGLNGGYALHGQDIIMLSEAEVFSTNKDTAEVVVPWTADETSQSVNEFYTTCVQVLHPSGHFGEVKCVGSGPY